MLIKSNLIKNLYKNVIKNENLIFNAKKTWNSPVIRSRNIQTTPKLNAIHPLIWLIAKPLTKLGAIIAGRGFRKWWTALPKIKRDIFWQHFKRHQHKYGLIFGSSGLIMFTYYETHIQEAPFTHRKRFILFDNNHLEEIERIEQEQLFEMYESNFVNLYSPYSLRALRVANRLFSANKEVNEIANIDWKLVLIDADAINAIAFPNGTLVVFTGLLDFVENDDELATILAHEMAHAILQHAAEELSHTRLVDVISIALTLMLWAFLPTDLTAALCHFFAERLLKLSLELPYSRELEKEADKVGLILTARACFDIRYSPGFWKRMSTLEELNMPEILSTHPTNETRAQDLESMVPEGLNLRKDCNCPDLAEFIEFNPVKHIPINVK